MDQKPTIVFVHGAWHTNEPFEEVQGILGKAGYGIKHVQLASSTPNGPYVQDIDDDVEIIQNTLNDVVETESDIVLVMHSYGGVVGSSAAKGFWRKVRKEKGKDGGIIHLVYLCAIVLPEGVSLKEGIGGETGPWVKIHV
jgi:pimeloyl-ACP methyl ester carboxylesterase